MANKTLRIVIPKNVGELIKLGGLVYQKHISDGTASPLNALADYDWNTLGPNLPTALAHHEKAEALRRAMEQEYEKRDMLVGDINGIIKSTRDLLKGAYSKNPKKIGQWGFTVNDTPKAKPEAGNS